MEESQQGSTNRFEIQKLETATAYLEQMAIALSDRRVLGELIAGGHLKADFLPTVLMISKHISQNIDSLIICINCDLIHREFRYNSLDFEVLIELKEGRVVSFDIYSPQIGYLLSITSDISQSEIEDGFHDHIVTMDEFQSICERVLYERKKTNRSPFSISIDDILSSS